jgi:hypothetical protein
VDYTGEEQRIHALLTEYAKLRSAGYRDNPERFATEFVLKLLKKRLFSSPQAFLNTLNRHRASLRKSARYETLTRSAGALARIFDQAEEDFADENEQQEAEIEALEAAARAFRPCAPAEAQLLNELAAWAERAAAQMDSKAKELLKWLESTVRPNGHWNEERVIIFTEYRDTQKWLHDHLARAVSRKAAGSRSCMARRIRKIGSASKRRSNSIPRIRPSGSCWPPMPPAKASTFSGTATGSSIRRSRGTRTAWNSAMAVSTATASARRR